MPLVHTPALQGGTFGRLRDDATVEGARAELETINRRLEAADPATNRGTVISVMTYSQGHVGPDAPMIYGSLWVAAWFVLLIACANLANLTLVRTLGRWRDFATRIALGAGQWRMMRQMFVESLMLASVAGALGWWITNWSVRTWAVATASPYLALDYTGGWLDPGLFGGDLDRCGDRVLPGADGQGCATGRERRTERRRPRRHARPARQTPGGGTGGRPDGAGHRAALGSRASWCGAS